MSAEQVIYKDKSEVHICPLGFCSSKSNSLERYFQARTAAFLD